MLEPLNIYMAIQYHRKRIIQAAQYKPTAKTSVYNDIMEGIHEQVQWHQRAMRQSLKQPVMQN